VEILCVTSGFKDCYALQLSAFAKYIVPPQSVTSTGDFRGLRVVVLFTSLTGQKCGFPCVFDGVMFRGAALTGKK